MFGEVILKTKMIYKWVAKLGGGGGADSVSLTNFRKIRKIHALPDSYNKGKLQTHKDFIEFRKFEVFLS